MDAYEKSGGWLIDCLLVPLGVFWMFRPRRLTEIKRQKCTTSISAYDGKEKEKMLHAGQWGTPDNNGLDGVL